MMLALPTTAASGKPPARLFAMVIRSGSTPACSMANILPVRANPVWISSMTSTMPCWSQSFLSAWRNSGGAM